jgi:hypothetical protein
MGGRSTIMPKKYDPAVRVTGPFRITFFDPTTIYVEYGGKVYIYHRWFLEQRWFYSHHWRKFSEALKRNKALTFPYINRLAERHEINLTIGEHSPDLSGKNVRQIPAFGRDRGSRAPGG